MRPGGQRRRDHQRRLSLLGGEVRVAGGQRQAVGFPHGRDALDPGVQVQLPHHPPDQDELLIVLLTEERQVRPHDVEQLQHHREHAVEVPVPGDTLQLLAQRSGVDGDLRVGAVHRLDRGGEDQLDPGFPARPQVRLEGPWVAVEVLVGRELQRVYEDRHDGDAVDVLPSPADQLQVAAVQRAHSRHQVDPAAVRL